MISSRLARRTKISHPAKQQMALIQYCWLATPFDRKAWPKLGFDVRYNSHVSNLFISAVSNVERSGHKLDLEERKYLRLLLSYWAGWSATTGEHLNEIQTSAISVTDIVK